MLGALRPEPASGEGRSEACQLAGCFLLKTEQKQITRSGLVGMTSSVPLFVSLLEVCASPFFPVLPTAFCLVPTAYRFCLLLIVTFRSHFSG
jgi:hypothetical protein